MRNDNSARLLAATRAGNVLKSPSSTLSTSNSLTGRIVATCTELSAGEQPLIRAGSSIVSGKSRYDFMVEIS
jgi:hypothetical protein